MRIDQKGKTANRKIYLIMIAYEKIQKDYTKIFFLSQLILIIFSLLILDHGKVAMFYVSSLLVVDVGSYKPAAIFS